MEFQIGDIVRYVHTDGFSDFVDLCISNTSNSHGVSYRCDTLQGRYVGEYYPEHLSLVSRTNS